MRIALLSAHSCPLGKLGTSDTGGMSVYIRELAREMGQSGHQVDIFTRAHDPTHPPVMALGENARLIHLRVGGEGPLHKLALYVHLPDFGCAIEDFRKREDGRYDLVYSHYWLSAWVGNLLQGWWHIPHLAMFHTLGAIKNSIGIGEEEPDLRVETERYLVKNCHRIIAATAKEKEGLISYYAARPESVAVIPCGIDLGLFRPLDRAAAKRETGFGDRTALFVGRLEPLKGVDRLLAAMARLKNGAGPHLAIIGGDGGDYEMALRRQCREMRLDDVVTFRGRVEHEALPRYYSAADVCVIPSYYESFGLVALESLACGTPVVSTRVGIAESVLRRRETGYLLADNTPASLAAKMGTLLARTPSNGATAEAARAAVAEFAWPNVARAVVRECQALIRAGRISSPD